MFCCCCYSCRHSFFGIFISHFFEIGKSAGSLISEAFTLIRTFQRLSATKSFRAKFSKECLAMFDWARNIVKLFTGLVKTNPLVDYELFQLYTFVFPISILMFISASFSVKQIVFIVFLCGFCVMFGAAFGYIHINVAYTIALALPSVFSIIICLLIKGGSYFGWSICCCRKINPKTNKYLKMSFSVTFSSITFYLLMIPIMEERARLTQILSIIVAIIVIFFFFYEGCVDFAIKQYIDSIGYKLMSFLFDCFTLLIIPATETFLNIIQGNYKGKAQCILAYIVISLLIPIVLNIAMIFTNDSSIKEKYRTDTCLYFINPYFEIIDILKQIFYAIASSYDSVWGCICIEFVWFILLIICRPYKNASDYSLAFGNSIVIFISNGAVLYSNYKDSAVFSLKISLILVLIACLPAIISLYLYFIIDFQRNFEELSSDSVSEMDEGTFKISLILTIVTPIAFFFYGTNITLITNELKIPQE